MTRFEAATLAVPFIALVSSTILLIERDQVSPTAEGLIIGLLISAVLIAVGARIGAWMFNKQHAPIVK